MKRLEFYNKILNLIDEYRDIKLPYSLNIEYPLKNLINIQQAVDKFNLGIIAESPQDYIKVREYSFVALYGEKYNRTIAWSDDDIQPEDEWLYVLSFPTGAFIFSEDYPISTFSEFFNELKEFSPKYCDTNNHNLYFTSDNAHLIHQAFDSILSKYRSASQLEIKQAKIDVLKAKLAQLENS